MSAVRAEALERDLGGELGTLLVGQRSGHIGFDEARGDGIDGDVARGNLSRQRLGKAHSRRPWRPHSWSGRRCPPLPTTEAILMMRPSRAFIMPRRQALDSR